MRLRFAWFLFLGLAGAARGHAQEGRELTKADQRKTCGEYLAPYRQIAWYYDFATASELARETGRPLFVIFCRSGTLTDPVTKKPRAAS